jgi:hypothetical protein
MKKSMLSLLVSSIAIVVSVVAICVAAYRSPELGFDYQGVLVGMLTLLVTVLIGWQIYTFIDFNSKKRGLDILSKETSVSIQQSMAISENTNWMIYHHLLLGTDPLGLEYRFLYHGIACLFHTSQFENLETCNTIVNTLLYTVVDPSKIEISDKGKNDLIMLLSKIRNPDAIKGYNELVMKILSIKIKTSK